MGFRSKHADQQRAFIAEKINHLFSSIKDPTGNEYSPEAVEKATGITASYIRKMRKGQISNPGRDVLEGLSIFFGISPDFWFQVENYLPDNAQSTNHIAVLHRKLERGNYTPTEVQLISEMLDAIQRTKTSDNE